jgi:hypothetical protein
MDIELRAAPRIEVSYAAVFVGDNVVGSATVTNLSVLGCAIETPEPMRCGDYLELRIMLPDEAPPVAIALAKVRWVGDRRAGLEFILVRREDQSRLRRLIGCRLHDQPMDERAPACEVGA